MKRVILYTLGAMFMASMLKAEDPQLAPYAGAPGWAESKQERLQWFADAKFGMFIHWGLYAPARLPGSPSMDAARRDPPPTATPPSTFTCCSGPKHQPFSSSA